MPMGIENETTRHILLTIIALAIIFGARALLVAGVTGRRHARERDRVVFWTRQLSSLAAFVLVISAAATIWLADSSRSATVAGFATAGLAVAAQRVVTAFAGYLVIIRG